ncbi:MAG: hypothetical protein EB034_23390, partial [Verrucomicrobia bacterium]|nr:hypothetical protein [Verrucomicrobiota bacterium]
RLVIATFGDPKTFNPITENEQTSRDIIRFLFLGLTDLDAPTEKVKPSLAHKWEVAEDQKTWTFHLRQGLVWSDGHPLTADDVVFTWNDVIYNPKIVSATADLFTIDGKKFAVSKVDDLTVRIVTPDVYAPFEEAWGGIPILPKHVLAKSVAQGKFESAYGIDTAPDKLVCSGPFKLKQFKAGELTLLERNPNFFEVDKAGTRLPYLDNVIYTTVPDMNAMSLRFLKGESDVFEDVRPDEYERFKTESASDRFKLEQLGVGPEKSFVWFNLNTNWVAQVKFSVDKPDAHLTIEKKKLSKLPDTARTFLGSVDLTLSIGNGPEQKKSVTLTQGMTLPVTVKFDAATVTLAEPNGAAQLTAKPLVDPKHAKWFLNTKFRQAVQHAIDRPSIVKSIFAGRGEGTDGFVSTAYQKWRNPNVVKYAYDVAKAKALL